MKKNRIFALALLVVAVVASLVVVLSGVWPIPTTVQQLKGGHSLKVQAGKDVLFPSIEGSPEISIPGDAVSGKGILKVVQAERPEGQPGWDIELEGATLVGQATLVFKDAVKDGEPAPLIGYIEKAGDQPRYVMDAEVRGADVIVRTEHFSRWFVQGWEWLSKWALDKLDRMYEATGHGEKPTCQKESEAKSEAVEVFSDSNRSVQWCLGKSADGSTVLKVNNSRGYAVSAERTPGLSISKRNQEFGQMVLALTKYITAPSKKGNTIDILGPGETIEYKVKTADSVAVRLQPSQPSYLASALFFGAEMATEVYGKFVGELALGTALGAMNGAGCVDGFRGMASADVTSGAKASKYFNDALATVMSCMGGVFKSLAEGNLLDMLAVKLASVVSWAWSGVQLTANGLAAAATAAFAYNGYTVGVRYPAKLKTYSGTVMGRQVSFEYPDSWRVYLQNRKEMHSGTVTISNHQGEEMIGLEVFEMWDGYCYTDDACVDQPVHNFPSTQGKNTLSSGQRFKVRNLARDTYLAPEFRSQTGQTKRFEFMMTIAPAELPEPNKLLPISLPEIVSLGPEGEESMIMLFWTRREFDTLDQAKGYVQSEEYHQIQTLVASFRG